MNNPTFSRIAGYVRANEMPAELKNSLLLLFFRMTANEQTVILNCLETKKETLPLFAELLTELEQSNTNLGDAVAIENLLKKYLEKISS